MGPLGWYGACIASGMRRFIFRFTLFAAVASAFGPSPAARAAAALPIAEFRHVCQQAIAHAEARRDLPKNLLTAISFVESAQWDAGNQATIAWPWTVTSGGEGHYFPDKQSAVHFVRELQRAGVRNIDVGCMQVNLQFHPDAFASVEDALDPRINALYAARFLEDLHRDNKAWSAAIRRYHSADPRHANPYYQRVLKYWNQSKLAAAEAYRQSVISAYRQRRAERLNAHADVVASR